jgi:hypothetical protein
MYDLLLLLLLLLLLNWRDVFNFIILSKKNTRKHHLIENKMKLFVSL